MTLDELRRFREEGNRPSHPVVLPLAGAVPFGPAIVQVTGMETDYELLPLADLDVMVVHASKVNHARFADFISGIWAAGVNTLWTLNRDTGAKVIVGINGHKWVHDATSWERPANSKWHPETLAWS